MLGGERMPYRERRYELSRAVLGAARVVRLLLYVDGPSAPVLCSRHPAKEFNVNSVTTRSSETQEEGPVRHEPGALIGTEHLQSAHGALHVREHRIRKGVDRA